MGYGYDVGKRMINGRVATSGGGGSELAGVRTCVVGCGEVLGGTGDRLRGLGAGVTSVADAYALMRQISDVESPKVELVVLLLTCMYPEELAVIGAIRAAAPGARVVVGATDGATTLLAWAIRAGVDGIFAGSGIEWLTAEGGAVRGAASGGAPQAGKLDTREPLLREDADDARHRRGARNDVHVGADDADGDVDDDGILKPLISPEELRALLGEEPAA